MKFNEIPGSNAGAEFKFGPNAMTLDTMKLLEPTDSNGYQIEFKFKSGVVDREGNPVIKTFWYPLTGAVETDQAWKITSNIKRFIDVRRVVTEEAEKAYEYIGNNSPEFNEGDAKSVANFEYNFIKKLLEPVMGKSVNVVMHYKGKYLNIPYLSENSWKLPFGKDPVVGEKLKSAPTATESVTAEPASTEGDSW